MNRHPVSMHGAFLLNTYNQPLLFQGFDHRLLHVLKIDQYGSKAHQVAIAAGVALAINRVSKNQGIAALNEFTRPLHDGFAGKGCLFEIRGSHGGFVKIQPNRTLVQCGVGQECEYSVRCVLQTTNGGVFDRK